MNNLINLVDRMIESSYPIDYNAKPFFRTALWEASWKGDEDVVQLLLKSKAKVDHADYQGRTPLHEVSYYGHLRMVDLLIQKGHPVDPKDKFDHTPLFRAVEAGRHEIVLKLVSCKAEIGSRDQKKLGLQHYAAFNGRPHMSEWLFYKGAWGNQFSLEDSPPSGGAMSRQATGSPKGTSGAPRPGHDEEGDMGDRTATMLPSMRRINKDQDLIDYVRQDFFAAPELAKKREEDDTPPTSEVAVNSRDLRKDADGGRQGGSKRVASDAAPHRPSMAVGGKDPAFTKQ
jgi:hypothetical protein